MLKKINYRLISQILFFALVALISLNHYLKEIGSAIPFISSASLHAICPFGGVAAFVALFQYDLLISKIHTSSFTIFVIIFALAIFFGPVVCSYLCPLGSIQEWIGKLGKNIFKKRYNHFMPVKLDKVLRYLRYVVLIIVVYLTTNSLKLIFLEVDPYFALFHFWSDEATIGGLLVLGITLFLSLFVERPWCKYACPFGALMGLTNYFSIFKIKRNHSTCIDCKKCDRVCPMNIVISDKINITDHQCIRCNQCTSELSCPVPSTTELRIKDFSGGGKKIKNSTLFIAIIIITFGGLLLADVLGFWQTASRNQPKSSIERHEVTGNISGNTTVEDIIGFGLTLEEIEKIMGIKIQNTNMPIRSLCEQNNLSFGTVKAEIHLKLAE
ncbi:MAG: 4Fe-4S binding protein [Desulfitobacteriaceae bacterium]|nr:4Fe-4S binding protein [Desulfitobacteriaceae bacterium]MDD4753399.1 4Fe-4S binding protein [Desulfitobacteriaceae bacterium]